MVDYRFYRVKNGHLGDARVISCADDKTAIMWADDLREGRAAELWHGDRLVRRFEPND